MIRGVALATLLGLLLGCGAEHEVVVTRDALGDDWPLAIDSAVVVCSESDGSAVLRMGARRYALDEQGVARGLRHAREVASVRRTGGATPDFGTLRAVCDTQVAARE